MRSRLCETRHCLMTLTWSALQRTPSPTLTRVILEAGNGEWGVGNGKWYLIPTSHSPFPIFLDNPPLTDYHPYRGPLIRNGRNPRSSNNELNKVKNTQRNHRKPSSHRDRRSRRD